MIGKIRLTDRLSGLSITNNSVSDEQLLLSVLNLFAPGTETLTSTLLWCFLYMQENPTVAQKVKTEISSVCLQNVLLEDKGNY